MHEDVAMEVASGYAETRGHASLVVERHKPHRSKSATQVHRPEARIGALLIRHQTLRVRLEAGRIERLLHSTEAPEEPGEPPRVDPSPGG